MKLLAFIFSWYILLLATVPCADAEPAFSNTAALSSANQGQQQHHEESCTPFCACACCGLVFIPHIKLYKINYNKPLVQKNWGIPHHPNCCSNYSNAIWQPPRWS